MSVEAVGGLAIGVAALVVATVSAFYARATLFPPKRRLDIRVVSVVPLTYVRKSWSKEIVIMHDGVEVKDPHVATLVIEATGRYSIPSSAFDASRPIRILAGSSILDLALPVERSVEVRISSTGDEALVGPDLLNCSRPVQIDLLTNGKPFFAYVHYLIDVNVRLIVSEARDSLFDARLPGG